MALRIQGIYFDGKTSRAIPAFLELSDTSWIIYIEGQDPLSFPLASARVLDQIGSSLPTVEFNGLARFQSDETSFHEIRQKSGKRDFVHLLEKYWPTAFVSLVLVAFLALFVYRVALPMTAKSLALKVPHRFEETISKHTIDLIDQTHFVTPSTLSMSQQFEVQMLTVRLNQYLPSHPATLYLRHGGKAMQSNAFALPDGGIVVTDEITKALNEDELIAVLCHEMGHVENHHGIRALIEGSVTSAILLLISGNADWTGLPLALMTSGYSRSFETEADDFAMKTLREHQMRPSLLSDALKKIDPHYGKENRFFQFFSSHPSSEERVRRIEGAKL